MSCPTSRIDSIHCAALSRSSRSRSLGAVFSPEFFSGRGSVPGPAARSASVAARDAVSSAVPRPRSPILTTRSWQDYPSRALLADVQYREPLVQSPVVVFESFGSRFRVLLLCCARFCFPGVARSDLEWCSPPSDCLALCVRFPLLKPEPRRPGERERGSASSPPPLARILAVRAASPPAAPTAAILSLSLRLRAADHAGKSRRNFSSFPRRPPWW